MIPPIYQHVDICHFKPSDYNGDVPERQRNTLIQGLPGRGKTYMAVAIARSWGPQSFEMVKAVKIVEIIHAMNSKDWGQAKLAGDESSYLDDVAVLVVDDLGAEHRSDFSVSKVLAILDRRGENNKATIVTTNLSLNHIRDTMDPRIASRLSGYYRLTMSGGDRRKAQQGEIMQSGNRSERYKDDPFILRWLKRTPKERREVWEAQFGKPNGINYNLSQKVWNATTLHDLRYDEHNVVHVELAYEAVQKRKEANDGK